jgi:hypothetical protein
MIEDEIAAIFAGQNVGDGDVDIDGVLGAFQRLQSIATAADLPVLVNAIQSPKSNFWTRELFAEPIGQLGGVDYLELLFEAQSLNSADGHDNDGLNLNLVEIAEREPEKCRAKLEQLIARSDFRHSRAAKWLLEFC